MLPYITVGCPTTGGGKVISGNSIFLIEDKPIACVGDKATCPLHKTVATIMTGDQHMLIEGKPAARANDVLSCGCKLLFKQVLVVGDNGGSNFSSAQSNYQNAATAAPMQNSFVENASEKFNLKFQVKNNLKQPIKNTRYMLVDEDGEIAFGTTDSEGYTNDLYSDVEKKFSIHILLDDTEGFEND